MSTPEDKALEDALESTQAETPETETPATDPQDPPAVDPIPEPDPEPPVEAATKAETRKPRTQAQKDKRKADAARRKQAIADAPRAPDPSKEDAAEQKRKADIRAKMAETQGEIDYLDAATEEKKDELRSLSGELYPHLGESDHHTGAVAGFHVGVEGTAVGHVADGFDSAFEHPAAAFTADMGHNTDAA